MKRELARKAIHVASAAVPLLVWLLPRPAAIALLVPVAAVAVAIDLARHRIRPFRYHFLRHTRTMLRPHERRGLAGATWMAVAYAAAVVLFPRPVAVAAMLFNGLGDAAAALVGKRWGRHRTRWGKSWEGFGAGLATDLAVGVGMWMLAPAAVPLAAAVFAALVAAAVEFAPLPLDDNLSITLAGGAAIVAASALIG
ncbi:MAG: phosphatidate cytidylyltransferase [Gemmatimonadetes bacterium]|nr:phosphatidate cytidylyltransferase [Gemmatimonadota bacterium]